MTSLLRFSRTSRIAVEEQRLQLEHASPWRRTPDAVTVEVDLWIIVEFAQTKNRYAEIACISALSRAPGQSHEILSSSRPAEQSNSALPWDPTPTTLPPCASTSSTAFGDNS